MLCWQGPACTEHGIHESWICQVQKGWQRIFPFLILAFGSERAKLASWRIWTESWGLCKLCQAVVQKKAEGEIFLLHFTGLGTPQASGKSWLQSPGRAQLRLGWHWLGSSMCCERQAHFRDQCLRTDEGLGGTHCGPGNPCAESPSFPQVPLPLIPPGAFTLLLWVSEQGCFVAVFSQPHGSSVSWWANLGLLHAHQPLH